MIPTWRSMLLALCQMKQSLVNYIVISNIWLQGKDKTQSCKSNKKTNEKFNNYINKKQKVQTIVLVNQRMSVKLRRKCSQLNLGDCVEL